MKSFKQYLSESDPNSWKPMPGYSYDGQDPNLRSDEEAEKTKEWYSDVQGNDSASSKNRRGDTEVKQSQVDAEGRPTGVSGVKVIDKQIGVQQDDGDMDTLLNIQREDAIKKQEKEAEARGGPGRIKTSVPPPVRTKKYVSPDDTLPTFPWEPLRRDELG